MFQPALLTRTFGFILAIAKGVAAQRNMDLERPAMVNISRRLHSQLKSELKSEQKNGLDFEWILAGNGTSNEKNKRVSSLLLGLHWASQLRPSGKFRL